MSSNGVTVMGPEARRAKWASWFIVLAAGRTFIGRLHEKRDEQDGWERYLSPFFEFNSGFAQTNQGLAEIHRAFPPLALSLKRMDLPKSGYVLFAFGELDDNELQGMEEQVASANELWQQMRAARSGILQAPPTLDLSKLKTQKPG